MHSLSEDQQRKVEKENNNDLEDLKKTINNSDIRNRYRSFHSTYENTVSQEHNYVYEK